MKKILKYLMDQDWIFYIGSEYNNTALPEIYQNETLINYLIKHGTNNI